MGFPILIIWHLYIESVNQHPGCYAFDLHIINQLTLCTPVMHFNTFLSFLSLSWSISVPAPISSANILICLNLRSQFFFIKWLIWNKIAKFLLATVISFRILVEYIISFAFIMHKTGMILLHPNVPHTRFPRSPYFMEKLFILVMDPQDFEFFYCF